MTSRPTPPSKSKSRPGDHDRALRQRLLDHLQVLRIPMQAEHLDSVMTRAEKEALSPLQFLDLLIGEQADRRRERSIERRIRNACFREPLSLETFDWQFNARTIDRVQIEALASGDFIRRRDNLVIVGQSGLGKSHLIQGIGRKACALGYRVRYASSSQLLADLTASLADQSLPERLRYYRRFELLIIDEFGLDHVERLQSPQAGSLLYKVIDARAQHCSTALVTNVEFKNWGEYLQDPPLAMALMDRMVDNAIILKLKGKSYRAHRAKQATGPDQ